MPIPPPPILAEEFKTLLAAGAFDTAADVQERLWHAPEPLVSSLPRDIPLLGWGRLAPADRERFLFVSGTPRSGTSALGALLKAHADVALFNELYPDAYGYLPAMFTAANVREMHRRGLLPSLSRPANANVLRRAETTRWVGDKRPNFMRAAPLTLRHFGRCHVVVVHVLRSIHAIAASYRKRAADGSWDVSRDHAAAVAEANMNNRMLLLVQANLAPRHTLVVLDFERFWRTPRLLDSLLTALDLDPAAARHDTVASHYAAADSVLRQAAPLPDAARAYIDANYDMERELAVRALALA